MTFLNRIIVKVTHCRYRAKCGLYQPKQFTCANGGGNFCGKYKTLNEGPVKHD